MPEELTPRGSGGDRRKNLPAEYSAPTAVDQYRGDLYPGLETDDQPFDWRRYVFALVRYKWLFLLALVVAGGATYWVWQTTVVEYRTDGTLWIEGERDVLSGSGPITTDALLVNNSWIQLLKSHTVLDSVVVERRLWLTSPREFDAAFATFATRPGMTPGEYELRVGADGGTYVLMTRGGATVEEGRLAEGIGRSLGWEWIPPAGSLRAGADVQFVVQTPGNAARSLAAQLGTTMEYPGNFLQVSLRGPDPQRIASIVNALMDRHVSVSAELTRLRLVETLQILEEQLQYTETELQQAERDLEEWRVRTITLPSDRPVAAGLEMTRNPVFNEYFEMRISLDEIRIQRERLQAALEEIAATGDVRIETLELIPSAGQSSELRRILDELVEARSELRALSNRYSPDYPPIQELMAQIESIEQTSTPRVVRSIIAELETQERMIDARVSRTSAELEAIPPRTIEEGRLERSANITGELYNMLRQRVEQARLAAASAIPDVRVLDYAQVPTTPLEDTRVQLAFMIFMSCLGAAAGGAILLDRTDAKFRYATDVSRDIGLSILGSIPRIHGKGGKQGVLNAAQALEAFRELRIHVGFAYGSAGPITLAISSPAAGEGKSLISSNLAVAFAEVGQRTLLVDGDTRRGDAHRLFGVEQSPGLVDYLKERAGQEVIQKTAHENLDFIGCGARGISTPELLASPRMAHFIGTLKRSYDVIILDCPPLASGGDPLILSTLMGNLAVVIRTGSTEKHLTQAKLDQLSRLPIRLLGAILNDVDPRDGYHYYYASYLPGYEPVPTEEDGEGVQLVDTGERER